MSDRIGAALLGVMIFPALPFLQAAFREFDMSPRCCTWQADGFIYLSSAIWWAAFLLMLACSVVLGTYPDPSPSPWRFVLVTLAITVFWLLVSAYSLLVLFMSGLPGDETRYSPENWHPYRFAIALAIWSFLTSTTVARCTRSMVLLYRRILG